MIGTSFSACVGQIADGIVAESNVEKIISRTAISNDVEFESVLEHYANISWRKNPGEAKNIARRLWESGKIEQPRLFGMPAPVGTEFWVESEDQIHWSDISQHLEII